ncbi:hypothetical protein Acsp05_38110 [Actinokineospora sp. NBRC 105648]|nr:hypothetical protein Acsp05_38110 [Actinokineospora sp. NBRC 105648]
MSTTRPANDTNRAPERADSAALARRALARHTHAETTSTPTPATT